MAVERRVETAMILLTRDADTGNLTDIRTFIEWSARNTGVAGLDDWRKMNPTTSPIVIGDISATAKQAALDAVDNAPLEPAG